MPIDGLPEIVRKNALVIFMSVELQLNAVNLALVAFSRMHGNLNGQVVAFFSMVVAAVTVHLKDGFFLPNGVEYVLTLFLASVALALTGSGAFSIDRLLEKRTQEKSVAEAGRPYPATVEVR